MNISVEGVNTSLRVKELLREKNWTTKNLAEKTGMSESYLTHLKNGTRRWNEDSLKRLAVAFEVSPLELFAQQRQRTDAVSSKVGMPEGVSLTVAVSLVPVVGDLPAHPSPYNNQLMQQTTGCAQQFIAVVGSVSQSAFALQVSGNQYAPVFEKGDLLIISPDIPVRSGDYAAVEYTAADGTAIKSLVKVNYTDEFVLLESVNMRAAPVALMKNKDHFRIIGAIIESRKALL